MKCIEERRSIRKYKEQDISNDILLQILESARLAPSGSNTQPWRFLVVRKEETKKRIVEADHNQKWMLKAPVFVVCVADVGCRIKESDSLHLDENSSLPELKLIIRDTAIAIEHILLEAQEQGIGTCWTGWYEQQDMREAIGIPDNMYICGVITMGYSAENVSARPRHKMDDIVMYEEWK